jgi:hypothetical protein
MKKNLFLLLVGSAAVFSIAAVSMVHASGMSQYTNSPADTPGDCTSCHGGASATPVAHFTATPAFGTGNTYMPNVVYTLSYNVTGYSQWGFDLELLNGNVCASTDAGTMGAAVSNCQILAATNICKGSGSTKNVTHNNTLATASKATWKWTAPASGSVYMYSTAIGSNGGQNPSKQVALAMVLNPSPLGIAENAGNTSDLKLFPNPASENLHLTYTLDKQSSVSIKLYDLEGRKVADLLNENLEAGEQSFDAALPSTLGKGIYNLNLSVDGVVTIKKLMIK